LCKNECLFLEDIDKHVSDLELLIENRNLKDIIFISHSVMRHLKQPRNGIPVKEYLGNKKDYSCVALGRYLRSFTRVKDVREKIQLDFKTIDV
jgi:TFIIF-interacting CTD phosphatase-like protein